MGIYGINERVNQLSHISLLQIFAHWLEIWTIPVAGAIPPTPIPVIDISTDFAHQVCNTKDYSISRVGIAIAAQPCISGVFPRCSIPPEAKHANTWEPPRTRVVPQVLILPIQNFVPGIV